jgi:hypothetical protein
LTNTYGIQRAVLDVHVVRVEPHQLGADRNAPLAALPARAVRVVIAAHDLDPVLPRHDILMAQAECLPDPHPGLEQHREQQPLTDPSLRAEDRLDLRQSQHLGQPPPLRQPPRTPATTLRREPLQHRLERPTTRPMPRRTQPLRDTTPL